MIMIILFLTNLSTGHKHRKIVDLKLSDVDGLQEVKVKQK